MITSPHPLARAAADVWFYRGFTIEATSGGFVVTDAEDNLHVVEPSLADAQADVDLILRILKL